MPFTVYKRLFEVNFIHLYYLDYRRTVQANGPLELFYNLPSTAQTALLDQDYDISTDLEVVPSLPTAKLMKNLRILWKSNNKGFFAGLEVERLPGDLFKPLIGIPEGSVFTFFIKLKNQSFYNLINHSLKPSLPGKYFFTNRHVSGDGKVVPSLSMPAAAFDSTRTWDMGEVALFGNNLRYALKTGPLAGDFSSAFPDQHYANAADRTALPKLFKYRLDPKVPVPQTVAFVLRTIGNSPVEVKRITKTFAAGSLVPETLMVDFRRQDPVPTSLEGEPVADGFYNFEIFINNVQWGNTQTIYLRDDIPQDDSVFAVIEMVHEAGIPDGFNLLNADGTIRAVKINGATNRWINQSVFEVRLLSRPAFWMYHVASNNGQTVGDVAQSPPGNAGRLVTTSPKRFTRAYQAVQYGQNQTQHLPNPIRSDLNYDPTEGKYLSEVYITLP